MWRRRADMAPESALPLFVPFIPYTDRFRVSLETWNVDNPYRHSAQRIRDPETADTRTHRMGETYSIVTMLSIQ